MFIFSETTVEKKLGQSRRPKKFEFSKMAKKNFLCQTVIQLLIITQSNKNPKKSRTQYFYFKFGSNNTNLREKRVVVNNNNLHLISSKWITKDFLLKIFEAITCFTIILGIPGNIFAYLTASRFTQNSSGQAFIKCLAVSDMIAGR